MYGKNFSNSLNLECATSEVKDDWFRAIENEAKGALMAVEGKTEEMWNENNTESKHGPISITNRAPTSATREPNTVADVSVVMKREDHSREVTPTEETETILLGAPRFEDTHAFKKLESNEFKDFDYADDTVSMTSEYELDMIYEQHQGSIGGSLSPFPIQKTKLSTSERKIISRTGKRECSGASLSNFTANRQSLYSIQQYDFRRKSFSGSDEVEQPGGYTIQRGIKSSVRENSYCGLPSDEVLDSEHHRNSSIIRRSGDNSSVRPSSGKSPSFVNRRQASDSVKICLMDLGS